MTMSRRQAWHAATGRSVLLAVLLALCVTSHAQIGRFSSSSDEASVHTYTVQDPPSASETASSRSGVVKLHDSLVERLVNQHVSFYADSPQRGWASTPAARVTPQSLDTSHMPAYTWLLIFTAQGCKPCQELESSLESLSRLLSPGIRVGLVDADATPRTQMRFRAHAYPAAVLLIAGEMYRIEATESRLLTSNVLVSFVTNLQYLPTREDIPVVESALQEVWTELNAAVTEVTVCKCIMIIVIRR